MFGEDFEITFDGKHCPSEELIFERERVSAPIIDLVLKFVKMNIGSCERLTIPESWFVSSRMKDVVFARVMNALGKAFADNDDISVDYQKPEIDGVIDPKIVVKNVALILERDRINGEIKELKDKIQKLRKA